MEAESGEVVVVIWGLAGMVRVVAVMGVGGREDVEPAGVNTSAAPDDGARLSRLPVKMPMNLRFPAALPVEELVDDEAPSSANAG